MWTLKAATLVADLPELGQIDGKTAAALAGLAPWSRDSGRQQGRRGIQGRRGKVRRVLYLAAQSAARHNPGLRDFYTGLARPRQAGQSSAGSGDAEAGNATELHHRPWHALGAEAGPGRLKTT